jgi:hypothetical protein
VVIKAVKGQKRELYKEVSMLGRVTGYGNMGMDTLGKALKRIKEGREIEGIKQCLSAAESLYSGPQGKNK